MPDRYRLHVRRVDTIGLVDKGDNEKATVVFWKRKVQKVIRQEDGKDCVYSEDGKKLGEHDTMAEAQAQLRAVEASKRDDNQPGGAAMPGPFDVTKLSAEGQAEFKKLTDEIAELKAKLPPPPPPPLAPEIQKRIDDLEKSRKDADERVAKLEDEREQNKFISIAKAIGFNADDWAAPLRKVHKALTPEEWKKFEEHEKALQEQIRVGSLYKTIGSGGTGADTEAEGELHAAVQEIKKAHPEYSQERAEGEVLAKNVQLRNRLESERIARTPQPQGD